MELLQPDWTNYGIEGYLSQAIGERGDAQAADLRQRRRRQVDPDRPACCYDSRAWCTTTCSSATTKKRLDEVRHDRRRKSTWRCSSTACRPSVSRASRSTSPTATSPPTGASSSWRIARATCSTRATWRPGASACDLAIILIDARQGVLEQTHRHSFICSVCSAFKHLRHRHQQDGPRRLDSQERFEEIRQDVQRSSPAKPAGARTSTSSRCRRSRARTSCSAATSMPWFQGSPLLDHLETVHVGQ